jgi:predicted unusual protein kinase regulating ubiquinone biosynthesis (AarF/ABC1/UbiB family)
LDETWIDTTLIFAFMDNSGGLLTMPFSQHDFTLMLQKQFDFEWEAYNMSKFSENFYKETSSSVLRFPAVSGDILSPCVLVESWGQGNSVDNLFSTVGDNWEVVKDHMGKDMNNIKDSVMKTKKELATIIFDMNMKMFLRDNFIHGDLHAGNLLYDESSGALTVLDAGLISQIPPAMNANFVLFIQGMCGGDANAITDQLLVFDNRNAVAGLVNEEVQLQRPQLLNTVQQACDHWVDPKTGMAPDG